MHKNFNYRVLLAISVLAWFSHNVPAQNVTPMVPPAPLPYPVAPLPSQVGSLSASPAIQPGTPGITGFGLSPGSAGQPRMMQFFSALGRHHGNCTAKLRASPVGKLLGEFRKPLSTMTGGLVPADAKPNHVELSAAGPQGTAAQIKRDQIDAPHRLAAIRALGEVDGHWYPEAQESLLNALRADRDECIRYEAALILSGTDCCSPQTIQTLRVCVAGTNVDGNPSERSLRVRNQAAFALERCLAMCGDSIPAEGPQIRPEYPTSYSVGEQLMRVEQGAHDTVDQSAAPATVTASYTTPTGAIQQAQLPTVPNSLPSQRPLPEPSAADTLKEFRANQLATARTTDSLPSTNERPTKSLLDLWRRAQGPDRVRVNFHDGPERPGTSSK